MSDRFHPEIEARANVHRAYYRTLDPVQAVEGLCLRLASSDLLERRLSNMLAEARAEIARLRSTPTPSSCRMVLCGVHEGRHEANSDCSGALPAPPRSLSCPERAPHGPHEWYDPAIRRDCPGVPAPVSTPGEPRTDGVELIYPIGRPAWLGRDQDWPCRRCGRQVDASERHRCVPPAEEPTQKGAQ